MTLTKPRLSITALSAVTLLVSACGLDQVGRADITRSATPAAEVACADLITSRYDPFGGVRVIDSAAEGRSSTVILVGMEGTRYNCTSPSAVEIPNRRVTQ